MILQCDLVDQDCLIEALETLNMNPQIHDQPQKLMGWQGDERDLSARIIVKQEYLKSASNDLGFEWDDQTGQFNMLCSDYDQRIGVGRQIKQAYVAVCIKRELQKRRFNLNDQDIQICLQSDKRKPLEIIASKVI